MNTNWYVSDNFIRVLFSGLKQISLDVSVCYTGIVPELGSHSTCTCTWDSILLIIYLLIT